MERDDSWAMPERSASAPLAGARSRRKPGKLIAPRRAHLVEGMSDASFTKVRRGAVGRLRLPPLEGKAGPPNATIRTCAPRTLSRAGALPRSH